MTKVLTSQDAFGVPAVLPLSPRVLLGRARWTWGCRSLDGARVGGLDADGTRRPCAGDVALVRVETIGHHTRVFTAGDGRLRLYPGDSLVGVFGNRYATDAFEAEVAGTDPLHLVTDAGMLATVRSRHRGVAVPTRVSFVGYLVDTGDERVNLIADRFQPEPDPLRPRITVLVVGTAMSSGKTTVAAKLVRALSEEGLRVAAVKLTGSVSSRDRDEFVAASGFYVRDFSDYGFPSTYLLSERQLVALVVRMLSDAARSQADVVVAELADGLLQREVRFLLDHSRLRAWVDGVLLAAPCAASALYGVGDLRRRDYRVLAVTGVVTNAPLFAREVTEHEAVRVEPSDGDGLRLAAAVVEQLGLTG